MILSLVYLSLSRESTNLYASQQGTGDCFSDACSFNEAFLTLRVADVIHIKDKAIYPPSYPSEFSDLIESAAQSNVTLVAADGGTVIDGKFLTGGVMYYLENQRRFTWGKFQGFTFKNFKKLIMSRQHCWSTYPMMVFQDCVFEDCKTDLFSAAGGTWVFINCVFRNIEGRPFKALAETIVEFVDCQFEKTGSVFAHGADLMFRNCIFSDMTNDRGGCIYARKTTLYVNKCVFVNCKARQSGGAIYVRESNEKFNSEISNNVFHSCSAAVNGSSVYIYMSSLEVRDNQFSGDPEGAHKEVYEYIGEVGEFLTNKYHVDTQVLVDQYQPLNEPDQFFPCDTYQRHEFDNARGNIYMDFHNEYDPNEEVIN